VSRASGAKRNETPISGLPEIGAQMRASRANPTCVDPAKNVRSAISACRRTSCGPWVPARARVLTPCTKLTPGRALGRDTRGLPRSRSSSRAQPGTERVAASFLFTISNSAVFLRSRGALLRPGFAFLFSIHPMRGERSAERRSISVVARFGARRSALVEARRASSGTRSPLGAPPWRFSVGGRASFSGISSGSVQRAPRSQVVVPGGRGPGPPGAWVTSRGRRTPLPAPPSARLRRRPLR
jgi:hypothetical protein